MNACSLPISPTLFYRPSSYIQWWASALGKSFSKNSKYSLAPPATASSDEAAATSAAAGVLDDRTGSVASNLESSAVRSEGKVGAWGAAGAA